MSKKESPKLIEVVIPRTLKEMRERYAKHMASLTVWDHLCMDIHYIIEKLKDIPRLINYFIQRIICGWSVTRYNDRLCSRFTNI